MTEHVLGGAVISPEHTELEADERLRPFHSHPVGKCSESVIGEVRPNSALLRSDFEPRHLGLNCEYSQTCVKELLRY